MPPAATTPVLDNAAPLKPTAVEIDPSTLNPATVTTMVEVRLGIDDLDRRIVTLLGLPPSQNFTLIPSWSLQTTDSLLMLMICVLGDRMRYIEAAARIKPSRKTVRDEWRKQDVITKAAAQAEKVNFPPELVRNIYEVLVEGSIAHEFVKFDARTGEKSEDATKN